MSLVKIVWLVSSLTGAGADYVHVGCYTYDSQSDPLVHQFSTTADDDTSRCVQTCQQSGFPYAALQSGGQTCSCTDDYSKYKLSDGCVYGCYQDGFPACGGKTDFSIYYTLTRAASCPAGGVEVTGTSYDTCLTLSRDVRLNFTNARSKCIQRGFDLVAISGENTLEGIKDLLEKTSVGNITMWIASNDIFNWNSAFQQLKHSVQRNTFRTVKTQSGLCTAFKSDRELWETLPCNQSLYFVCMSVLSYSKLTSEKSWFSKMMDKVFEFYSDQNNMATFFVLPIFVLLILSCCLPYMCHRIKQQKEESREESAPRVDIEETADYMKYSTFFGSSHNKHLINLY